MALTQEKQYQTMFPREGYVVPTPVVAATYYRGSMISVVNAGGNARKATPAANTHFVGICQENRTIATAGDNLDVLINSPFWVVNATLAVKANNQKIVYLSDDDTFTVSSASNAVPAGRIVAIEGDRFLVDPKQVGAA